MMNEIFRRKWVWLCGILLGILLMLSIFIIVTVIVIGPSNFVDECLELVAGYKRETWVFLIAGSKGWNNYRHQADISHAYQTLLNNGIPADHIVVMMTDDVAFDPRNPSPGELFNHPNGSDVYQGVRIDYSKEDVTSENFLLVLIGDKSAMKNVGSGRVIESNRWDNIFVNFVGHGASGLLSFPENYLYADELHVMLELMIKKKKFNKMLLYIEACKSGSLFDGTLRETSKIFAVTAAGPRENSWSTYCYGNRSKVLCLGDEFSVTWIEDQSNIGGLQKPRSNDLTKKRTVLNHFNYIRTTVRKSNVMPYGDFSVGQDKLSAYIGKVNELSFRHSNIQSSYENSIPTTSSSHEVIEESLVSLHQFSNNTSKNTTNQWQQNINYNNIMRQTMSKVFKNILQGVIKQWPNFMGDIHEFQELPSHLPLHVFPCYRQTLDHIMNNCFSLPQNQYSLKTVHIFFNLCARVLDNSEWKYSNFSAVFHEVVHNVCSKNSSTFSDLRQITGIF